MRTPQITHRKQRLESDVSKVNEYPVLSGKYQLYCNQWIYRCNVKFITVICLLFYYICIGTLCWPYVSCVTCNVLFYLQCQYHYTSYIVSIFFCLILTFCSYMTLPYKQINTHIYIYIYIMDLACYPYFHWFFNPEH
jgi:hypothetical protein